MKADVDFDQEKNAINIDLDYLLLCIPDDKLVQIASTLSCQDAIIKNVTDQILDGWTEDGYHGAKSCTAAAHPHPQSGLDWACREVAKRSSEVAKKEIERLEEALTFANGQYNRLAQEYHKQGRGY